MLVVAEGVAVAAVFVVVAFQDVDCTLLVEEPLVLGVVVPGGQGSLAEEEDLVVVGQQEEA